MGLIGNFVLAKLAVRDALSKGFRTEFFIKTGLVLLGASIKAGWRPVALFASATVVNIVVALGLAVVLFGSFGVS